MRIRDERGVVFPSPVVMLSVIAVAMAGLAFFATRGSDQGEREITTTAHTSTHHSTAPKPSRPAHHHQAHTRKAKPLKPVVQRAKVLVEVYNNSGITGLAARIGTRADQAGWQVVGEDNWYGSVPSSTVYFPARLHDAAKLLALDLGIRRVQPAVDAMKLDRLTVILTGDPTG